MGAEAQLVCSQIVPSVLSRSQLDIKMSPDESNTTRMLEFSPKIRSGSYADIGPRSFMEDEHLIIDDLSMHLGSCPCPKPSAFYGVFDGHGGPEAATFVRNNFTRFFFQDINFPHSSDFENFFLQGVEDCLRRAFLSADLALSDDPSISTSSGTTALTALIFGTLLLVANAGDCRAVLSRKGKAIDLSQDHRPTYPSEKRRVEELGGFVDDGYLNGILSVTRALGDWDMKLPSASASASASPLIAEPELRQITLTEDDEFLIIGCDGIWDVMSSQEAVSLVRRGLRQHDDPDLCAKELVKEALRLHTTDNLTVIVVCLSSLERQREQSVTGSWRPRRLKCSLSAEALSSLRSIIEN